MCNEKFVFLDEIGNAETDKAALATKIDSLKGLSDVYCAQ